MKKITTFTFILFILFTLNSFGQIAVNITSPSSGSVNICAGNNLQITASVSGDTLPYTVQWYENNILMTETSLSFNVIALQDVCYKIKITDSLQQIAYDSIDVNVNPLPPASAGGDQTICEGMYTQLIAFEGASYLWSNLVFTQYNYVNPSVTTTYTVTVIDVNGCTDNDEVVVIVAPIPISQINVSPSYTVCAGATVTLTGYGGGYYQWHPSNYYGYTGNTIIVNPETTTLYTLTVTSQFGCISTTNVYINVTPNNIQAETKIFNHDNLISSESAVCLGDTVLFVASGGDNYQWYGNSSFIGNTNSDTARLLANSNNFYVWVNISNSNGCSKMLSDTVFILEDLMDTISYTVCIGDSIQIGSWNYPNTSYIWNNGSQTSYVNVSPVITTNYQQTISNGYCSKVINHLVKINQWPQLIVSQNPTICGGNSTTLTSTGSDITNYHWSNGNHNSSITVHPFFTTTYSVTASNTCGVVSDYVVVNVDTTCNLVSGKIYYDLNSNSILDPSDIPAKYVMAKTSNGEYTATNQLGEYKYYTHDGIFDIAPNISYYMSSATSIPANYNITFNTSQNETSFNNDFLITGILCDQLVGMQNSLPRKGFGMSVYLYSYNYNFIPNVATVKYVHPKNFVFLNSSVLPDSTVNDTLYFKLTQNNGSYYSNNVVFNYHIPETISMGYTTQAYTEVSSTLCVDNNMSNNQYTKPITVVASYDPNDISSVTEKYYTPDMKSNNDSITYTIRFQNTGTDTAVNIRVLDTISSKLDMSTFEMLGASHPYSYTVKGTGIVEWKFLNIMLPDSTTNEARSHGLISYRIKPKSNFTFGDSIESTAHIYFDFNTPVATNTNVIYFEDQIIGVKHNESNQKLNLYPNPTKDLLFIETAKSGEYQIMDIAGKVIQTGKIIGNYNSIQTEELSNGIYIFKFSNCEGVTYKKFFKN